MLDFRMDTFLSVCDTMNYRKSSELLHITQPAVTQHIQHLEHLYGEKLFLYQNRRLKKTRAAVILEQYARSMKLNEENMRRKIHGKENKCLKIGATKTIGSCVIGPYVEKFIQIPDQELSLVVDNTSHLLDLLEGCKLDFALIEGIFDRSKYGYRLYSREEFVGICACGHPFAGRDVSVEELFSETLICREEGSGTRAILENKLMDFNKSISSFQRKICISSFPLILEYVEKNYGISFVYRVLADQQRLAQFTIQNCRIEREFNFVYLKNTGAEEKIDLLMKTKATD